MLADHPVYAALPTADVAALRPFYEDLLGFKVLEETAGGIYYQAGQGTFFAISRQTGTPSGTHTQMGFAVPDVETEVAELRARGVVFELYEGLTRPDGIAAMPAGRAAWFKDPDGNLIGMIQLFDHAG